MDCHLAGGIRLMRAHNGSGVTSHDASGFIVAEDVTNEQAAA